MTLTPEKSKPAGRRREFVAIGLVLLVALSVLAAYVLLLPKQQSQASTGPTHPTFGSTINIGFDTEITAGDAIYEAGRVGYTPVPDGYAARIGAELAVNQTNAAGGVDGKTINLIVEDSQSSPQTAEQNAQTLDQKYGVLAITGPTNQEDALAIERYTQSHGVPFVASSLSSAVLVTPTSNWTVSVQPDAVEWGAAAAKYVSEVVPGAKIALMTENADQQVEMAAGVKWYAETYKNESLVFDQTYDNAQFPWGTAAEAAKFSGANAVIVSWLSTAGYSQANVVDALQSVGFSSRQIFVASIDDQVSDLGTAAEGITGVTLFDSAMSSGYPNATAFVKEVEPYINGQANLSIAYCGICPVEIGPNYYYSYLGMEMIINSIRAALTGGQPLTRASFMSALKGSSVQDAFGNTLTIGASGSSSGTFYVAIVGGLSSDQTTYRLDLVKSFQFAPGSVPSFRIAAAG